MTVNEIAEACDISTPSSPTGSIVLCEKLALSKVDRKYRVLLRFGNGYLLNIRALPGKPAGNANFINTPTSHDARCLNEESAQWVRCNSTVAERTALLGQDQSHIHVSKDLVLVASSDVGAELFETIIEQLDCVRRYFDESEKRAERAVNWHPYERRIIYVSRNDHKLQGSGVSGEVLDNVMYMILRGDGWEAPSQDVESQLLQVLSHEYFHLRAPPCASCAARSDKLFEWAVEGFAEYFSETFVNSSAAGRWSSPDLSNRYLLRRALNDCIYFRNGAPGPEIYAGNRQEDRLPYVCGVAMVAAILVSDGIDDESNVIRATAAIGRWKDLQLGGESAQHDSSNLNHPTLGFVSRGPEDQWLSAVLATLVTGQTDPALYAFSALRAEDGVVALSTELMRAVGPAWFHTFMESDCNGMVSFEHQSNGLTVVDDDSCRQLHRGDWIGWDNVNTSIQKLQHECGNDDRCTTDGCVLLRSSSVSAASEKALRLPDLMCRVVLPKFF